MPKVLEEADNFFGSLWAQYPLENQARKMVLNTEFFWIKLKIEYPFKTLI